MELFSIFYLTKQKKFPSLIPVTVSQNQIYKQFFSFIVVIHVMLNKRYEF
jgi:hypothetical protein